MSIHLFTDAEVCTQWLAELKAKGLIVLATGGASHLEESLRRAAPELVVAELGSPRFARLNFDAIEVVILDAPVDTLLSSAGRRLVEALAKLAGESLHLALVGAAVSEAGGIEADGVHAGLDLIPATVILPDLRAVSDLRALLATLSGCGARVLALDAPVGVQYDPANDQATVFGAGSALLVSFVQSAGSGLPTARLHVLSAGLSAGWPE